MFNDITELISQGNQDVLLKEYSKLVAVGEPTEVKEILELFYVAVKDR